jgi:hypothetical protein
MAKAGLYLPIAQRISLPVSTDSVPSVGSSVAQNSHNGSSSLANDRLPNLAQSNLQSDATVRSNSAASFEPVCETELEFQTQAQSHTEAPAASAAHQALSSSNMAQPHLLFFDQVLADVGDGQNLQWPHT